MQSNHTINILRQWRIRSTGAFRHTERTISGNKKKRAMRRGFFRADRQLTKRDLKLLARGNVHLEELEALELLDLHDNIDHFEYVDGPHDDWIKEEMRREQEEWQRDMAWIEFESVQQNRFPGCEPIDEDDSLML